MLALFILFVAGTASLAAPTDKIAGHRLAATSGGALAIDGPARFGVVGNTRDRLVLLDKGRDGHGEPRRDVVGDITAIALTQGLNFLVLTGDMVRSGTPLEWGHMDAQFAGLLDGETPPKKPVQRIPSIAVAGDREGAGDEAYASLEGAFPGTGAPIGYGRVATWSWFDVVTGGVPWRMVVLDSAKKTMGPRWREQLAWIPEAVSGDVAGILVFIHQPASNLADGQEGSEATQELLEAISQHTGMLAVKAVFFAGPSASQVLLPGGHFGALHIGTGGGGAPAADLFRTGRDNSGAALSLVPSFDKALLSALQTWRAEDPITPRTLERASATGKFEGTAGVFEARQFPTYGWWAVELADKTMKVVFRMRQPDGTFKNMWAAKYDRSTGWVSR